MPTEKAELQAEVQSEVQDESEFNRFVRAIFKVPKEAVKRAEALRPKRPRNGNGKHKDESAQ